MVDEEYAKHKEEYEKQYLIDHPHMYNIDIVLHEYMMPDLRHNYKLSLKINDDTIVIFFDKKTDVIDDYGFLAEDGSLVKAEYREKYDDGMSLNGNYCTNNKPQYAPLTVFSYRGKYEVILGIHEGKIDALFKRGFHNPVSIKFNLDTSDMEHKFNTAVGGKEVRPTCSFEYKKDLIDIKVAKSIGLIFEHKIC